MSIKRRIPMANVVELNNCFRVQRVNYFSTSSILKPNKKYIELAEDVASYVEGQLKNDKIVEIPKNIKRITIDSIVISEGDELERKKNMALSVAHANISKLFINMNFMDLYDFIMINNKFSSIGAFIHNENKEEQYLKIINTGDEKMIDDLELFLENMDKLEEINRTYKKIKRQIRDINDCKDPKELDVYLSTR